MKELTTNEIASVSGAGWLQDTLSTLGGKIGSSIWTNHKDLLDVNTDAGIVNLADLDPSMGGKVFATAGALIGKGIENQLSSLPVVGNMFSKLFSK